MCVGCGVQHIAEDSAVISYDELLTQNSMAPVWAWHINPDPSLEKQNAPTVEEVVQGTTTFLESVSEQPFFLSVGFYETYRESPSPDSVSILFTALFHPSCQTRQRREKT